MTYGRTKLANFFGLPGFEELVQVLSIIPLLSSTLFLNSHFLSLSFLSTIDLSLGLCCVAGI